MRKFRSRFFLWQTTLILLLELYYVAMLGGIYTILKYQENVGREGLSTFEQFSEEAKKLVAYQEEFKKINMQTDSVSRYQKAHLRWSVLPELLHKLTPDGVVIVRITTKDYTVSIIGQAEIREQFLRFENALKEEGCVSDVRVPISNLFSQKEVDFQVDFKLKKECLIQS